MNKNIKDLTGKKFGKLTVLGLAKETSRKTFWVCQCECGNCKTVRSDSLQDGTTKSCGCLKKAQDKINLTANHKHLQSGTRIYAIWSGIKSRCNNIHNARYMSYGGRGITICKEWNESFESFYKWALANGYNESLTIDRINNGGNYEPNNCRWTTNKEQSNNRRSNVLIIIGNAKKTLTEWCEIFQLNPHTIMARYERNGFISIDDLFNRQHRDNQQTADIVERRG